MSFKKVNNSFSTTLIVILVSLLLSIPVNYFAQQYLQKLDNNPEDVNIGNFEDEFLQYIENNGDKVVAAIEKSFQKKQQAQLENRDKLLESSKSELYADTIPSVGNKNAKFKLVEFYDYNCGYCKKAFANLQPVINDKDSNIEIFFIDFPILGVSSEIKAKTSIAGHLLDKSKYLKLHAALMSKRVSNVDDAVIIATQSGYNKEEFTQKISSAEVNDILKSNRELAQKLSVQGTPAFIFNNKFVNRVVSYELLKELMSQ